VTKGKMWYRKEEEEQVWGEQNGMTTDEEGRLTSEASMALKKRPGSSIHNNNG
jgi:hypothetical protein